MTSNPDEPERAYEYPSLEDTPWSPQPYAPVDPPSPYPPPMGPGAQVPPTAFPPPYHGGIPYDPYAKPQTTSGQAIGALVASLVGVFTCCCGVGSLVGIVLGIMGMNECRRSGRDGHGLALAGVIVGAVGLVLFVAFWILVIASPNKEWYFSTS
jgi:hypothetical protein